jgi:tRNA(Ile)-lysidine synthase
VIRQADELLFVTPDLRSDIPPADYEYSLSIPGRADVHEAGITLEARRISADEAAGYNSDQLLDADSVTGPLVVRNWRAGDRYWPVHTSSPKKVKELLQERHIARPERDRWTVILKNDELVWMRGFPAPAKYRAKAGQTAVVIIEIPTNSERET